MAKVESKNKQNPKLVQSELQDGRASLALEYYLGRNETRCLMKTATMSSIPRGDERKTEI
ncbi:hypothetical protein [Duncaniella muris]|uniref:hypothetical protein n=1 Tax=Duncaniella muris TaxID=2094150 RepID=UPI003F6655C5